MTKNYKSKNSIMLWIIFAAVFQPDNVNARDLPLSLGSPLVTANMIIAGSRDGNVYALDPNSNTVLWTYTAGAYAGLTPVKYKNLIFVSPRGKGELHAINLNDGSLAWIFEGGHVQHDYRDKFINGIPVIHKNYLYLSSEDMNVYKLDPRTGKEIARLTLGEEPQAMELAISEGIAYIGAWDGYLYAIDLESMTVKWKSETDNDHLGETTYSKDHGHAWISQDPEGALLEHQAPYVTAVPLIDQGQIYFADWSGSLMAVEKSSGIQIWRHTPETKNLRHAGPRHYLAEYENTIYYGTLEDGHIYGVNKIDGLRTFKLETGTMINGPMFSAGRLAFILEFPIDSSVVDWSKPAAGIFNMETQEISPGPNGFGSYPNIVGSKAYLGLKNGTIMEFDMFTGYHKKIFGPGLDE